MGIYPVFVIKIIYLMIKRKRIHHIPYIRHVNNNKRHTKFLKLELKHKSEKKKDTVLKYGACIANTTDVI